MLHQTLLDLGLVDDLSSLTIKECRDYLTKLDIICNGTKIDDLQSALRESYVEGRALVHENNGKVLIRRRMDLYRKLKKLGDSSKLSLSCLRFYAKRLGISRTGHMQKQALLTALMNLKYNSQGSSEKQLKTTSLKNITAKLKKKETFFSKFKAKKKVVGKSITKQKLKKKKSFITKKKHTSKKNKQKKKKYKPNRIELPGYGKLKTRYNEGKGDCFFFSTIQGLERENYKNIITHAELRDALATWYQDDDNVSLTQQNIAGNPSDIIPHLPDSGLNVPAVGWEKYLENKSWSWWGNVIRSSGTWVGALELPAVNEILTNLGINVAVNIFDSANDVIHGDQANAGKTVILLYLAHGHFELLDPDMDNEINQ